MNDIHKILARMRETPGGIRFSELRKVCEAYFGQPRQSGGSHLVFKTPWPGDPLPTGKPSRIR